ncbi:putative oxidoreductase YfjR [Pullulanibacillus camelliae]|uniref:Putative oxidoreductase YfjR n=1 Tax=Pullulanibacillus camelliae TaxID=1707096 RepID=A0A8J2VMI2_9BACL|nr:NAD(P)-dependent oxidoreductase [Pullulanibacillus camelliae]GGE32727.1 putative oxidoreductase YfjR [Pullulanibacillus camelliae]
MNKGIGFIGLGHLGFPLAVNLMQAGYALRVYNRTASKAEPLVAQGAQRMDQPADTVTTGGIVMSIVWDDASLESVVTSPGFLERLGENGLHISMTTVSPEMAQKLADKHAQHGSTYIEAPIFGRPEAVAAKQLLVPFAGLQEGKDRAKPLLEAMGAQGIFDFGEEVGAATLVKLVGNFLIGSAAYSMWEAVGVAKKNGVDPKAMLNMLTSTLFSAPIYKSYGNLVTEGTTLSFEKAIPMKDLGLLKKTAQPVDAPTPVSDLLYDLMEKA